MKETNKNFEKKYWLFGDIPRTCYEYVKKLETENNKKMDILIPDALDGYTSIVYLRYGHNVDHYEPNDVLINGGIIENFKTEGFKRKLLRSELEDKANIYMENFYETKTIEKYDFVYCYRSLHLERNEHISLERKIRKLLNSVQVGGYIYIYYYLDDKDIAITKNKYLKLFEMKSYFDFNDWEILYSVEGHNRIHKAHVFNNKDHIHKVASIFAQKKSRRKSLVYRYVYTII